MKLNDDMKKEISNNYFSEGVHKVKIGSVHFVTDNGKEYAEFLVVGDEGQEGTARVYFTEKAATYSFNTIRGIFVHNSPESSKDKTRDAINAIEDTETLEKQCQKLIGKECWYMVQKSDQTYVNNNGETKNSYNKNIYHYEPKMKESAPDVSGAKYATSEAELNNSALPDDF